MVDKVTTMPRAMRVIDWGDSTTPIWLGLTARSTAVSRNRVVFRREAARHLEELVDFIADAGSPDNAASFKVE